VLGASADYWGGYKLERRFWITAPIVSEILARGGVIIGLRFRAIVKFRYALKEESGLRLENIRGS
jgi:hypothetical protein